MSVPTPADEKRHKEGPERLWSESWYMDWFDNEGKRRVRADGVPQLK